MKYLYFDEIDSTNSYLKREYESLEDMTLVCAGHQTAGKGRRGRKWEDDKDSLMFSILLKKDIDAKRSELLPLLSGVSLYSLLGKNHIQASIKWPNDVLIQNKKCAGILLEAVTKEKMEAVILGIGINVNNASFPENIRSKAISLYEAAGRRFDKKEILNQFVSEFVKYYGSYLKKDDLFLDVLQNHSYLDGREVILNYYGEDRHGKVLGIAKDGSLLLLEDGKETKIKSGEVTLEHNYH